LITIALRMMQDNRSERQKRGLPVISQKSFVRKRKKLQKNLEASLATFRKGSDPPVNTEDPAFVEHMARITQKRQDDFEKGPMQFMDSLFATAERIRRDPKYKEYVVSQEARGLAKTRTT
jgi:hypothetical protein